MNERELYQPLIKGANAEGWLLWRVKDGTYGKNPFDISGVAPDGRAVGFEVKKLIRIREDQPIGWSVFESHQLAYLKAYQKHGGHAIMGFYGTSDNRLILVRYDELRNPKALLETYQMVELKKDKEIWTGWSKYEMLGRP